jgi:hypothetical protein
MNPKHTTLIPNCFMVELGKVTLYFSYQTLIAFNTPDTGLVVSENRWGTATGKHLNEISDNKKIRKPYAEFAELWEKASAKFGWMG